MVGELPVYMNYTSAYSHTHIPLCWYSSPDFDAVQFSHWAAAFLLRGYYIAQRSCAVPFASKRHVIFRTVCPSWRYRGALLSCPTPSAPVKTSTIKHMLNYDNISNIIYGCRNVSNIARYILKFYRRLPLYIYIYIYNWVYSDVEFHRVSTRGQLYIFSTLLSLLWLQRNPQNSHKKE